jgi:hypothetical protein
MQEGQLLMTQADRDRLVTLRKAKKRLITQREAALELEWSVRQVKRLLYAWKKRGDEAVIHGLRGRPSNRRMDEYVEKTAVKILSADVYQEFGPTLAAEYLQKKHKITASKEDRAAMDDARQAMAGEEREGQASPCLAAATESVWGVGAVGYQRARLAGGTWGAVVSDRHDRRCDQPIVRTVRAARFDRGEHAAVVELPGKVRTGR